MVSAAGTTKTSRSGHAAGRPAVEAKRTAYLNAAQRPLWKGGCGWQEGPAATLHNVVMEQASARSEAKPEGCFHNYSLCKCSFPRVRWPPSAGGLEALAVQLVTAFSAGTGCTRCVSQAAAACVRWRGGAGPSRAVAGRDK